MQAGAERLVATAMRNRINRALLSRLPSLGLEQCFLVAGCLFQAVWNRVAGEAPVWGVKDYDVFYFDPDLSWEAEDAVIRRAAPLLADLGVSVEFKNQARVHVWYERRFGHAYPQLRSSEDGIDRFLVACTCVGIEVGTGRVYAPYGLGEMERGVLRVNPLTAQPGLFAAKAAAYRARWPWLRVIERE